MELLCMLWRVCVCMIHEKDTKHTSLLCDIYLSIVNLKYVLNSVSKIWNILYVPLIWIKAAYECAIQTVWRCKHEQIVIYTDNKA